MAENIYQFIGSSASNFIQQINAEGTVFDVAVKNGITFHAGAIDTTGATWTGEQAIDIYIPTLTDLVQDPIRFAGTVGSDGIPKNSQNNTFTAAKGDLVYITANCTFGSEVCEAGDMAVYDGTAWRIIQGENQVSMVAPASEGVAAVYLTDTLQNILTIEGTTLKLAIDYADLYSNFEVTKNSQVSLPVYSATATIASMHLGLSQASGSTLDISKAESIDLPTALADGTVSISDKVLLSGDFTFNSGSFPTISKNASAISVSTSHSMSIGKVNQADGASGDYVTSVVAIKGVSLVAGTAATNDLTYMSGLVAASGKSFVSGIHAWTNADGETPADFTVPGAVSVDGSANTFISGLGAEAASGDLVSSITVGEVSIGTGTGILTGVSGGDLNFVKSVTFGNAVQDTAAEWFYSSLGSEAASGDVVTSVSVGATSLVSDTNSAFKSNAMVSASVNNHVLSFTTAAFMQPVKLSKEADDVKFKSFSKTGVKLSGFSYASDMFTTGSLSQATTTVSYKSVLSKAVSITQGADVKYYFDKEEEHAYAAGLSYAKLSVVDATVSKNTPKLENTTINVTIPADTVAVDLNAGTLPSLTIGAPTGTISGSVNTALASSTYSWSGVDNTKMAGVNIPGGYSLTSDAGATGFDVAVAGTYNVENGYVQIADGEFVTNIFINSSAVPRHQGE